MHILFITTPSISLPRLCLFFFFFSSRRRHTRFDCDWSSDVCSSDLELHRPAPGHAPPPAEPEDRRDASEKPAVPHEPAAPKQGVPLPREQHVPDLRPDDPSDHGREQDIGGAVFIHSPPPQHHLECPTG